MSTTCLTCSGGPGGPAPSVFYDITGSLRGLEPQPAPSKPLPPWAPQPVASPAAAATATGGRWATFEIRPLEKIDPKYERFPYMS